MKKNTNIRTQEKRFLKILKKKIYSQAQFAEEYKEYYGEIAQSTISTYFDKFNIIKGKDGAYFQDDSDDISDLISQTCYYVGEICSDLFQVIIKCNIDSERNVCKAITKKFPRKQTAVIPAYGSVVVLCKSKQNANTIQSYIKRYYSRSGNEEE